MNRARGRSPRAALLRTGLVGLAILVLSGCGTPTKPIDRSHPGTAGADSSGATDSGGPQTPGPNGVTSVPVLPVALYPSGDPCASLSKTEPASAVPPSCRQQWEALHNAAIPGQDAIGAMSVSHKGYGPGVDSALAGQWITAFLRTLAFQRWAEATGNVIVDSALDPPGHSGGPIETAMKYGAKVTAPACSAPSALVAVTLEAGELATLRSGGWPQPSTSALLVTFPACSGIVLTFPDGAVTIVGATKQPITRVVSGTVHTVKPFGRVWLTDGDAACGTAGLARVCKFAGAG